MVENSRLWCLCHALWFVAWFLWRIEGRRKVCVEQRREKKRIQSFLNFFRMKKVLLENSLQLRSTFVRMKVKAKIQNNYDFLPPVLRSPWGMFFSTPLSFYFSVCCFQKFSFPLLFFFVPLLYRLFLLAFLQSFIFSLFFFLFSSEFHFFFNAPLSNSPICTYK